MALYGLTIFIGAFLLFQVQPLIGKYILPWFGGSPSVWTTCMLFFQVALLAGYAYAHLLSSRVRPRWQVIIQLGLSIGAVALLPVIPPDSWKPQDSSDPTWRIIALLACTIGLPYVVLSATSPLLQHWFSRTEPGRSPYRLYALSNVGSLLALASYPSLFETHFTRQAQARIWGLGFVVYGVGIGFCAWKVWREKTEVRGQKSEVRGQRSEGRGQKSEARSQRAEERGHKGEGGEQNAETPHPFPLPFRRGEGGRALATPSRREEGERTLAVPFQREEGDGKPARGVLVLWLALPACASMLLLATTNKMCQEVAVVPFLWVVPLGLYLLSFIICFESPRWYRRFPFGLALAGVFGAVCWTLFKWSVVSVPAQMWIYGAACFICCMVCHGEVYRLKPDPRHLTTFYLMLALGGALGGFFVAVVAPLMFNDYFELQFGLALCGLLFLRLVASDWQANRLRTWRWKPPPLPGWGALACGTLAIGWVSMAVAFWVQAHQQGPITISKSRNFYGVLTVFERTEPASGLKFAKLLHGRTAHGLQFESPARASWPTLYYCERSGIGLALQAMPPGSRRIGVVGLGVGTLATYAQRGDYLRVYEINPEVIRLAKTRFNYLTNCAGKVDLVLGDARLSLEKEPPQDFDLLVLDAFSSDAIPVHLLTEEAFKVYQRHLKTNGVLAVHISNSSLDLEPVVANAADRLGYEATLIDYRPPAEKWWDCRSKWVLMGKAEALSRLNARCPDGRAARADLAHVPLWTDDFTSLFQILWRPSIWEVTPSTAERELQAAMESAQRGDTAGAVGHYHAALDSEPDLTMALNNLAWVLASNPDPALRNGAEAVKLARRACELTNFKTTVLVGTLAAAYAEAGQFNEAVSTAEKACGLAEASGDTSLLQRNRELLRLYREARPARD